MAAILEVETKNDMKKKFFLLLTLIGLLAFTLRVLHITVLPPYWEEAALGYDAYSILQTGKDHHGTAFPIVAFESFGDWKPAGYFYLIVPFIALFDLSVLAVRLPAVLAGVSVVLAVGVLAKRLGSTGIVTAILASISPWLLLLSRGGWEAGVAMAFSTWALLLFILELQGSKKKVSLFSLPRISAVVFLVAALYTYQAAKVTSPLFGFLFFTFMSFKIWKDTRPESLSTFVRSVSQYFLIPVLVAVIFSLPILLTLTNPEITKRAQETSLLATLPIAETTNTYREYAHNSLASRLFFHRYTISLKSLSSAYLDHFSVNYLFFTGDENPRHNTQLGGMLYSLDLVFIILGLVWLYAKSKKYFLFILLWLLIAPIPAAFTTGTPHALRSAPMAPVLVLLVGFGIEYLYAKIQTHRGTRTACVSMAVIFMMYGVLFTQFWRHYLYIYPSLYSREWQVGYDELYSRLATFREPNEPIAVSRFAGRPAMFLWFYTKQDPIEVQSLDATVAKDQGEYLEFQEYHFYTSQASIPLEKGLVAVGWDELEPFLQRAQAENKEVTPLHIIRAFDGSKYWAIGRVE